MLRRWELEWFYQSGAHRLFPEAWQSYLSHIPEAERGDMILAYHQRLTSADYAVRLAAAQAWAVWEGATSNLLQDPNYLDSHEEPQFALSFACIENHYFIFSNVLPEYRLALDALQNVPNCIILNNIRQSKRLLHPSKCVDTNGF